MSFAAPVCKHPAGHKCFANIMGGRCDILNDTTFYFKLCPFFKTLEELKQQRVAAEKKLKEEN